MAIYLISCINSFYCYCFTFSTPYSHIIGCVIYGIRALFMYIIYHYNLLFLLNIYAKVKNTEIII